MERAVLVYCDLDGEAVQVGRLWTRSGKGHESASFEYIQSWLRDPRRFAVDPALSLTSGPHHTAEGRTVFGALGNSAPDRWGRALMLRDERKLAKREKRPPRTLTEADFLLRVDDGMRQGAIRFREQDGGPFLAASGRRVPPFLSLGRLLGVSEKVLADKETDEELRILLAPGSSVGGARPKSVVLDREGNLSIAKFGHADDGYHVIAWEAVTLALARDAGIRVPEWRLHDVLGKDVLLLRRFDRRGAVRVPFLSAMSMLGAWDGEHRSYMEIADALRLSGSAAQADVHELWRRIAFNVMVSNVDDHLRNHGFLHEGPNGWRLSPAYDMNPVPSDLHERVLSTAIDDADRTASIGLAMDVCEYFDLSPPEARRVAADVGRATAQWREVASGIGISRSEIVRMESAFEHQDLQLALKW